MTYSYTQISSFLACPRRYRYQYLEGWKESQTRAAMLFGRAFEQVLAAFFLGLEWRERWDQEWWAVRELPLVCSPGESWESMLDQGYELLELFVRQQRVHIARPLQDLQIKFLKRLDPQNEFVGFIDAVGALDGQSCLMDWKTSASCYAAQPEGIVALDPQLVCYSWLTDIAEVALVVFVRKRLPEIQYLRATITEDQRAEFGRLVEATIRQIEAAEFFAHSGIRFPQNQCSSCAFIGLCLKQQPQVEARLDRKDGVNLDWLDELVY